MIANLPRAEKIAYIRRLKAREASRSEAALPPEEYVSSVLGEHVWSKQAEIMRSVDEHRFTAVPSGHGVGKSFVAARVVARFIATRPPGSAFAVTTAPTGTQVRAILWREIGHAHAKGNLPGRLLTVEWKIGDELVAMGRKPADYAPDAFQGLHAESVLVVIDEACGVPKTIWDAARSLATTVGSRILAIGNPDDATTEFYKVCEPDSGWNVIPISIFDSPNFTSEPVPESVAKVLTDHSFVDMAAVEWGIDTPMYDSKILGRFPKADPYALVSLAALRRAGERFMERLGVDFVREGDQIRWLVPPPTPIELGVDVAREGKDSNEIYCRWDRTCVRVWGGHEPDTVNTTGRVTNAIRDLKASVAKIDVGGVGGGIYDSLARDRQPVRQMKFGAAPYDSERFVLARDEWFWTLKQRFDRDEIDVDPQDQTLAAQLSSIRWRLNARGRIEIESKDKMKERGLKSPDRADAVAMAFGGGGGEGSVWMEHMRQQLAEREESA